MLSTDHTTLALELAQAGPRPIASYLHVPFCYRRCGYCNFSLLANREDLHERFVDAILTEMSWLQTPQPVETLFLGGGTPSILDQGAMERLLGGIRTWLPVYGNREWTIEANPVSYTHLTLPTT
jgi:oxygen-independent coproporphyrinogen-3 oxidase